MNDQTLKDEVLRFIRICKDSGSKTITEEESKQHLYDTTMDDHGIDVHKCAFVTGISLLI